jgi:hypothetical protein
LHAKQGESIRQGGGLATLWYNDPHHLGVARELALGAFTIGAARPRSRPLVLGKIT